jgi:hypothetical protein
MTTRATPGDETPRELAHRLVKVTCAFGMTGYNGFVHPHSDTCDEATAAIEARDASHAAHVLELETALRPHAFNPLEPGRCGACGWLVERCDKAGPSCRGVASRRALAAPGTPPPLKEET